jgi:putative ABC transport system permease protein
MANRDSRRTSELPPVAAAPGDLRRRAVGLIAGSASWLDIRLGVRLLLKSPLLTAVGVLGIAVAIAIAAVFFAVRAAVFSELPLDDGERVVAVENWDQEWGQQEGRILHDFVRWREELRQVQDLGAYRTVQRNLINSDGRTEQIDRIAEMTPSGFRLARVRPHLGRTLIEADGEEGAAPVAVLGYDLWRARFAGAPDVLGRTVQLGDTRYTVVGVMPQDFAFPVNHRMWVPLRTTVSGYKEREGPEILVFGRLAPGATLQTAQAELDVLGKRAAAVFPDTHRRLRPRAVSYPLQILDGATAWEFYLAQFLVTVLLVLVSANVAILVYARTVTRYAEMAVRSALGASRRRIVGQLFVEALVLATVATCVGLGAAKLVLMQADAIAAMAGGTPFWMEFGLAPSVILNVLALTVVATVIVGVLPGLAVTRGAIQTALRASGGGAGFRFGPMWTALIIAQVALTSVAVPPAVAIGWPLIRAGMVDPGGVTEQFLTARLELESETPPRSEGEAPDPRFAARYAAAQQRLVERLRAEPGVSDVVLSVGMPGEEATARIEVDAPQGGAGPGASAPSEPEGLLAGLGRVDVHYFDIFEVPLFAGRGFQPADLHGASTAVIVNHSFAAKFLGGGSPLGRRVRHLGGQTGIEPVGPWYEVVGVVGDFPTQVDPDFPAAKMYHHPISPGRVAPIPGTPDYPVSVTVRVRGTEPAAYVERLRAITAAVDPNLRLHKLGRLDQVLGAEQVGVRLTALAIAMVMLSVLVFCAAGIYALTSFTVTQRRREIGIRAALGGHPRSILRSVFNRALVQLGLGGGAGLGTAFLLDQLSDGEFTGGAGVLLMPAVAVFILVVGLIAAIGPVRRALRIEPIEVLRGE